MSKPRVGLANLGNTCYLNSVLQALASCPDFVAYVASISRAPAARFCATLLPLLQPDRARTDPPELPALKRMLGKRNRNFAGTEQQDAHELLCTLLGAIDEEAAAAGASSCSPFVFTALDTLKCEDCGHTWIAGTRGLRAHASEELTNHLQLPCKPCSVSRGLG